MNIHACRRKIRYATLGAARRGHAGMAYYACAACHGWHVTTPNWQRSLLRALQRALHTLPLTPWCAGRSGDGPCEPRHMKQGRGIPSHP